MCGIAGWIDPATGTDETSALRLARMCGTIAHRGPDDDGMFLARGVALGMRRLAIVDLAGGQQPMASDRGRFRLVFNGEIFNHNELRSELAARGEVFRTKSDTEIVLKLFERDGLACLDRLNGMFAIAVWDERTQSLHLARDRMGVKPLYYHLDGDRLIFASEIKAILSALPRRPEINQQALWDYFTFRYIPQPQTIWRGIFKLPPAHHLTLSLGDFIPRIERWWDMPRPPATYRDEAELVEEFDSLLSDATRLRMLADVPVGVLLSGGLDSSLIAARAASSGERVKTFSIAFESACDIDERPYARQVARAIAAEHHEMVIGHKEVADFLPSFVHYADEPMGDAVCVALYHICRLARDSVTVVLAGEGADETLGGYAFDQSARRWDEAASLAGARALPDGELLTRVQSVDPGLLDLRHAATPPAMTVYMSAEERLRLFGGRPFDDAHRQARAALRRFGDASPLSQALYVYCQDWLVEDLLMKADKMSMATSLELRTPFLDYRLVEAAARLPDHLRVGRNERGDYETKRILRRLARRGELPADIVERPKMGFPVPIYEWLREPGRLLSVVRDHLTGPNVKLRDYVDPSALADIVARGTAFPGKRRDQHVVFNALVMEMWLRHWK